MKIRFGNRDMTFPGGELGELRDSNELLNDMASLHQRIAEDGYLLLRGLIDRDKVLHARRRVLEFMDTQQVLTPNTPVFEGVMPKGGRGVPMMGRKSIGHSPDVLNVIESDELFSFFSRYFGEPALTFYYKWLRAVGNEGYTGAHMDYVYMGRGSANLHTVWVPFGDIPVDHGTLAMCVGSHNMASFARVRETYGQMDVDRDQVEGWFSREPMEIVEQFGGQWLTTEFRAGDVMIFGMHVMHSSTTNLTNRFRLSCDVRYQPASDPVDKRWAKDGPGYQPADSVQPIEAMRTKWGV